jgi:hypothetical protein
VIFKCVACFFIDDGADETARICTEDVRSDCKCLSSLQVAMMKFVGFDGKGAIWHEITLDYHIDEMGFRSGTLLSVSPRVFGNWWCIVIVLDDGGAGIMYCWYRGGWGVIIIVNDSTTSLWCLCGCIGGQDGLSMDSQIPHMDWFLVNIRVM